MASCDLRERVLRISQRRVVKGELKTFLWHLAICSNSEISATCRREKIMEKMKNVGKKALMLLSVLTHTNWKADDDLILAASGLLFKQWYCSTICKHAGKEGFCLLLGI